ncbi:MAG TPA: M20/M25/M40 family metallo-hydrolase [Flavisolibacter sp.]|nr:M20/M25/M40 family metallo-hydrolase [Flavisolibacter sp.]
MARILLLSLTFFVLSAHGQKLKKEDKLLAGNLQEHATFLSSDALEGRRTGSAGEQKAAEYISGVFQKLGLTPKGSQNYMQEFEIGEGKQVNPTTHLLINETELLLNKDFYPLTYSVSSSVAAMPSIALQETGMPWFVDLKELLEENKNNPHFDKAEAVRKKADQLASRGATALFFYNTSSLEDGLAFEARDASEPMRIPVVYITKSAATKYLADETASLDIKLKVDIGPKIRKGRNVVGFIDNGAATTVVLGAHYDHLGWGEDGNSLVRGVKEVHNGADDNASGTAALLELARLLKSSKTKGSNFMFIAFSGEELGLFGSKYFVEHPTTDLKRVNYMINMDMVGRLNDSSKMLTVGGYGTSAAWGEAYAAKGKSALFSSGLKFRFDSSGTGPSDHTSFYRQGIPVLFYFTGLHSDYHKPSDDAAKLNISGEVNIVKHVLSLVETIDKKGVKLPFNTTREMQTATAARFSVSLGIMPDYTYSGAGVRADGVSENRPAQKAGIKTGDIITALGPNKVTSMESYMQALGKFKKGDKTIVTYQRGKDSHSTTVEF